MTSAESERTPTFQEFREILDSSPREAASFVGKVHAADVAEWLQDIGEEEAWHVFSALEAETQAEILETLQSAFDLEPIERTSAPATRWRYADGMGEIGVVATVSQSFCETCDRVRITADGQFRSCLFATDETDVRALLRDGSSDDVVAEALERTVAAKWAGHQINQVHFIRPRRSMSEIGG